MSKINCHGNCSRPKGCFLIICLIAAYSLFFAHGVPTLHRYLQEDRHHIRTKCTIGAVDDSETQSFQYRYYKGWLFYHGTCHEEETRQSPFLCIKVMVSYQFTDNSILHAQLFRSYQDAKYTGYQCTACGCGHSEDLKRMDNLTCFFHPGEPQYVYMMSESENSEWIIFIFTLELLFVITLGCSEILCAVKCCVPSAKDNRQLTSVEKRDAKLIPMLPAWN